MSRAKAILQSTFPYNISARCINREWFQLPLDQVWQIFCRELSKTCEEHGLVVHSFVLMSNHFHLIASTPRANVSQCMLHFMGRSSRALAKAGNRINETFAGRHYKCILHEPSYYLNAYKYNYRNPVKAGICEAVEHYRYSTLQAVLGVAPNEIPLADDTTYKCNPEGTLKWLNTQPPPEKLEAVRFALRRQYFLVKRKGTDKRLLLGRNDVL